MVEVDKIRPLLKAVFSNGGRIRQCDRAVYDSSFGYEDGCDCDRYHKK